MDRLPLIVCLGVLLAGCESSGKRPRAPASRVDAVSAKQPAKVMPLNEFCDVEYSGRQPPEFAFPELTESTTRASGVWSWINVWATWCEPCIAEMPLLRKWSRDLTTPERRVELVFLSVDEDDNSLREFSRKNPGSPTGPRIKNTDAFGPWVEGFGLDSGATIPVNIFVNPNGGVVCARTGAMKSHHYEVIARLMQ